MSYNSNTGIISAPVSIDDVKRALGESSNDLATLCTSNNINPWSRFKPVDNNITFPSNGLYNNKYIWYSVNNVRDWWLGGTDSPAIDIPLCSTFDELKSAYWVYNKPKGGSKSPYRLTDFIGYNVLEKGYLIAPIHPYYLGNTVNIAFGTPAILTIRAGSLPNYEQNVITIDDIINILHTKSNNIYAGIYIYNVTKNIGYMYCSSKNITLDTFMHDDVIAYFTIDWKNRTINETSWTNTISLNIQPSKYDKIQISALLSPTYNTNTHFSECFPLSCFKDDGFPTYKEYSLSEDYVTVTQNIDVEISSIDFVQDDSFDLGTYYMYNISNNNNVISGTVYAKLRFRFKFSRSISSDFNIQIIAQTSWDDGSTSTVVSNRKYYTSISTSYEYMNENSFAFSYWENSDYVGNSNMSAKLNGIPILDNWDDNATNPSPIRTNYKLIIRKTDEIVNGTKYKYVFNMPNEGIIYSYKH